MPLPPYIKAKLQDKERYQTVYSRELGSAAAPTAGLHFTKEMLQQLQDKGVRLAYVTLHVGLGTFRPVKEDDVLQHKMHSEHYAMSQETADLINQTKAAGGRVICVGTTSCRTVESIATFFWQDPGLRRVHGHFHLSWLSVQGHGRTDYKLPSAGKHLDYAGFRFSRLRQYHACLQDSC